MMRKKQELESSSPLSSIDRINIKDLQYQLDQLTSEELKVEGMIN